MHSLAPKVPNGGPVLNQTTRPVCRLAAALLFSLIATAVSEDRPGAQTTAAATWTAADVGSPAIRGIVESITCSLPTLCPRFSFTAAGTGIAGAADQFTFLYQRLTGDGSMVVRVEQVMGMAAGAEAGLMLRESLNANSKHASVMLGPSLTLRRRTTTGGSSAYATRARPAGPIWMKLDRAGDVVTASTSMDGSQWTVQGTQTVAMALTIYAGIAVTSRTAGSIVVAVASNM